VSEQLQTVESTQRTVSDAMRARLRNVSILATLRDDELDCLGDAREIHIESGEYVARQGEPATFFWILLSGQIRIIQTLPDGREQKMATMPAGTAFGELPLLANIPNAGNLIATEPCDSSSSTSSSSGT
jgi:CRP-like cAMP-binding protein